MKVKKSQIVMLAAAVLGVVAILMMFATAVSLENSVTSGIAGALGKEAPKLTISGFLMMFGGKLSESGFDMSELQFNFVNFLALVFVVVGLVGVVLTFVMKKSKIGKFLAIGGFVVAGILFFCFSATFGMSLKTIGEGDNAITGSDQVKAMKEVGTTISLGVGAIMAGIFSLVAAVASALATFLLKD